MEKKKSKTRNIISIVLVALIGLLVWSMVSTQSKWKYSDMGLEEYEKGNYQEAIENFSKAIDAYPDDASLYNNRGLTYFELKKYDKALSDFSKAIELKPDYAVACCNRGLVYFKTAAGGNMEPFDKAILDFSKAIELEPKYVDAYYNRGLAHHQFYHWDHQSRTEDKSYPKEAFDRFNKAVTDFRKVLELDPDYVLAYAGLGNAHYLYNEWDKATEYYNKALTREDLILKKVGKKGLEGVYYSRARNYNQLQRTFPNAFSDYKKVLELNPESQGAFSHIAMISVINGNYKGGLEVCNRAFRLIETTGKKHLGGLFYNYRGQCYFGLEEYDRAISDFKKAMVVKWKRGKNYRCMGFCYLEMGETEKAKEAFEKGIAHTTEEIERGGPWAPELPSLHISYPERGLCYLGLGEYEKAIHDFKKTREFSPPFLVYGKDFYTEATKYLGIAYRQIGDDEKAKLYLEEALKRAEMPEVGMTITAKEIRELLGRTS
jgi:tetratricopeptide (TPR) repeat protein